MDLQRKTLFPVNYDCGFVLFQADPIYVFSACHEMWFSCCYYCIAHFSWKNIFPYSYKIWCLVLIMFSQIVSVCLSKVVDELCLSHYWALLDQYGGCRWETPSPCLYFLLQFLFSLSSGSLTLEITSQDRLEYCLRLSTSLASSSLVRFNRSASLWYSWTSCSKLFRQFLRF